MTFHRKLTYSVVLLLLLVAGVVVNNQLITTTWQGNMLVTTFRADKWSHSCQDLLLVGCGILVGVVLVLISQYRHTDTTPSSEE